MLEFLYVVAVAYGLLGLLSITALYVLLSPRSRLHLIIFDYLCIFNECEFVTRDEFEELKKHIEKLKQYD